jgi:hypothetical protein
MMKFTNGARFEGEFVQGEKHGNGTFFAQDNSVYEGGYEEDVRHGLGVHTDF